MYIKSSVEILRNTRSITTEVGIGKFTSPTRCKAVEAPSGFAMLLGAGGRDDAGTTFLVTSVVFLFARVSE